MRLKNRIALITGAGRGIGRAIAEHYGREGAPITYRAWVCTNPDCGFNLRIDNGEISFGRAIGQSYK